MTMTSAPHTTALLRAWHLMALLDDDNDEHRRADYRDELIGLADANPGTVRHEIEVYL